MKISRVLERGIMVGGVFLLVTLTSHGAILDGTTCKVKVTPDKAVGNKDETEFDDTLSFTNGKFTSKTFLAKGFKPGVTRGEVEPNEAEFEIEQTNDTGDVLNWQGEIRGNHVGGHMHWKKKNSTTLSYYFNGTWQSIGSGATNAPASSATHD